MLAREIGKIPDVIAGQIDRGLPLYIAAGQELRRRKLRFGITCARGSSGCAALYFKYLAGMCLGLPVLSAAPSLASVYGARLRLQDALCLTISQSGQSSDVLALRAAAREAGAHSLAIINDTGAQNANDVLPMCAGKEQSVAATKSFIASMTAVAAIVAEWSGNRALLDGVRALPESLARALQADWNNALAPLSGAPSLYIVSRGPSLAAAKEAALKTKELCRLHAEAISAAELIHGPLALAGTGVAAMLFDVRDAGHQSICAATRALQAAGVSDLVIVSGNSDGGVVLPPSVAAHPLLDALCQTASFYAFVERLTRAKGYDPDSPKWISKQTDTV